MAQTKYTYSIANDTLNGKVVNHQLREEIHAQGSGVNITVDRIESNGDVLKIFMSDIVYDHVNGESAALSSIVSAHDGIPKEQGPTVVQFEAKHLNRDGQFRFQPAKSYKESSKSFTTPDFSNRQSWWYDTNAVAGEVLNNNGDNKTYVSQRTEYKQGWGAAWINWKKIPNNARHAKPQLKVKVYVNDVLQTSGYQVNHGSGSVVFDSVLNISDVVKADYHYAKSSLFELVPEPGKKLLVNYVETQFSVGCDPIPEGCYVIFQAVYNGPAVPALGIPANYDVPVRTYEYHDGADFMNEATGAYVCDPFMELTKKQNVLPWNYLTGHTLKPPGDPTTDIAAGEFNKLKCLMVGDKLISNCEIATGTFYCVIEDL